MIVLLLAGRFSAAELEAHRGWMDEAQERKEDVREALASQNAANLVRAAAALEQLTVREQRFWARAGISEAKPIAARNRALAQELLRAAKAARFAKAEAEFATLERSCASCHDAHFEKRFGI